MGRPSVGLLLVFAAALLLLPCASCYSVLFFPLSEKTHMLVHLKLATELAKRGNTVHFMTADCLQGFAERTAASMAPDHQLQFITHHTNCSRNDEEKKGAQLANPVSACKVILANVFSRVDEVLSNSTLMEQLQQLAPSIDIMVNDILSYGMLVANKLGLQYVDLDVGTAGALWEAIFYGAEPATSFVPAVGTFFPTNGMTFWQRVINLAATKITRAFVHYAYWHPTAWLQTIIKKHSIDMRWPYVHYMMLLTNSNWVTEPPRAVAPNTKYVGPILPEPAAELPQQLREWLEGSGASGTVFISFGGTLEAPLAASRTLVQVIKAMPRTRFVWKLPVEHQAALHGDLQRAGLTNVLIRDWLPQNDLLGHPQLKAFVTQGGYLSMAEAAYHAVPVLGMPFIPGQGELIRFAQDQGRARRIPADTLLKGDAATFIEALQDILSNPSYMHNAAVISHRLHAAPRPYAESAAELVEYAAAVKDHGPFLNTQRMQQHWYQQVMLDVVAFYLLLAAVPLLLLWRWLLPLRWRIHSCLSGRDSPLAVVTLKMVPPSAAEEKQKVA